MSRERNFPVPLSTVEAFRQPDRVRDTFVVWSDYSVSVAEAFSTLSRVAHERGAHEVVGVRLIRAQSHHAVSTEFDLVAYGTAVVYEP